MPAGSIIGSKGPAIFIDGDDAEVLMATLAVVNSASFGELVALQLARTELAQSYEVGLIQQTPVPALSPADTYYLSSRSNDAWRTKQQLGSTLENTREFLLPKLLVADGSSLRTRANSWGANELAGTRRLGEIQTEIDSYCVRLYKEEQSPENTVPVGHAETEEATEYASRGDVEPTPLVGELFSWSIGVAFGRFDLRLATAEESTPTRPEPFAEPSTSSPGMLVGDDGLPPASACSGYPISFPINGLMVDDRGHDTDLVSRSRALFEQVFDESEARWHEAAELVGARNQDLRLWFAKDFFAYHIKQYSRSRRKAPIYWQLATPSASYSVWCYYHRLTRDTFFRVANDYVTPKVDHEERKLNTLRQEAGPDPSSKQRKEIDAQETIVAELRAFLTEVKRIAPLWNPNLNDGVIINFAPLWRLVPQHKAWQKECKKVWDKLVKGDYDWAHLAMHLWPERVVPKCQDDRSLAIAHGLEDEFWVEDDDGKWTKSKVEEERVAELIAERSSSAVKAALDDLLSAPTAGGSKKRKKRVARG
jgi:hypothetical protein